MEDELELKYELSELPSAQHRAGLAGLVLIVQYLQQNIPWFRERENVILELLNINEFSVSLKLNLQGLQAIFDLIYQADTQERSTEKKIKNYTRIEEFEVLDNKDKTKTKTKLVKKYFYNVIVPRGAFLKDWDESEEGLWIKLWRDMLWNIVRGVPATRNPFNYRVDGASYSQDVQKVWEELQNPNKITGQSSSFYLGAMATNAENIPTKDKVRYQFLLQFWVFVTQIYCPAILDKDGKREVAGYALAIPDVANLKNFCKLFRKVLKARDSTKWGYLPSQALIDLPEQGALDLFLSLRERIATESGDSSLRRMILGVEIIHAQKVGNNIKIRSNSTVEPITKHIDKYETIKKIYWCPWFRKQRLINLFQEQPESNNLQHNQQKVYPWTDFDAVFSRIPRKWLQDKYFSRDARQLFEQEVEIKMKKVIRDYPSIVYKICQSYVLSKLESKYKMKWQNGKPFKDNKPTKEEEFNEKKHKIANEAFLAVRSRTENQVFIDYFVSTFQGYVKEDEFVDFVNVLYNETSQIRAITLLALSSQFSSNKKAEDKTSTADAA
ncbi:MAG: type I-MYXAN CRISPR-associated protein Cmx8 [Cyanobacteriota bacterium]|nr:type I-MYXAN CRISPR-associated protein Cmx8 [Cyanobacteriota bacterium]